MIEISDIEKRFEGFFRQFLDSKKQVKYFELISALSTKEKPILIVEFPDIRRHDPDLAKWITENPFDAIAWAEKVAKELLKAQNPQYASKINKIFVQFGDNAGYPLKLREVDTKYLYKLITIEGLMVRVSQVTTLVVNAVFKCRFCGARNELEQESIILKKPSRCTNRECGRSSFELIMEENTYDDYQTARIQEKPEELPPGQIPRFLDVSLRGPVIENARPGDLVMATGVLVPFIYSRFGSSGVSSAIFHFNININYIEPLKKEAAAIILSKDEIKDIKEFASKKNPFQQLIKSFAPSIHGLNAIKESLLLSLFGGQEKILPDGIRVRGDAHILLVGDPGTAKSELLKYVASIAPKGLFTVGRGTTAAGLTAAVIKDASGSFSLEAGALVLADRGVCCIDEMDKMNDNDRVAIHEALEQQTVSIAKGGIVGTLNARATVIAAANPSEGRYNANKLASDNISLPVTLLSRFDLIHVIRDEPDFDRDQALVKHVLDIRSQKNIPITLLENDFIKKYIVFSKSIQPILTDESRKKIEEYYLKMRERADSESPISISARQLEALIRLSEARARSELKNEIELNHVETAIRLTSNFLRQIGVDPETGEIDVDIVLSGRPARGRSQPAVILNIIKRLFQAENNDAVPLDKILDEIITGTKIDRGKAIEIIDKLHGDGTLFQPRTGFYAPTSYGT